MITRRRPLSIRNTALDVDGGRDTPCTLVHKTQSFCIPCVVILTYPFQDVRDQGMLYAASKRMYLSKRQALFYGDKFRVLQGPLHGCLD